MLSLSDTHIPGLTHNRNKMPVKQRQKQSGVNEHRAVTHHCMNLTGHCHLSLCSQVGQCSFIGLEATQHVKSEHLSPSPSENIWKEWKILQQNLGAVKQIQKYFSLLVFWLAFRILELAGTFHSLLPDLVSVSEKC